jgi:hypothetical protein
LDREAEEEEEVQEEGLEVRAEQLPEEQLQVLVHRAERPAPRL